MRGPFKFVDHCRSIVLNRDVAAAVLVGQQLASPQAKLSRPLARLQFCRRRKKRPFEIGLVTQLFEGTKRGVAGRVSGSQPCPRAAADGKGFGANSRCWKGRSQQRANLFEGEPREPWKKLRWISVAEVAQEVRLHMTSRDELLLATVR